MMFMNEWDIENALRRFNTGETPNLAAGARTLSALAEWTNRNSDGWAYWPKPCRAAKSLMTLLEAAEAAQRRGWSYGDFTDVTAADLAKALRPIKAFLTRQGVSYDVLGGA
ncbi:MAG: hypothetical protein ACOH10_07810 [Rhodoglobus sp.]